MRSDIHSLTLGLIALAASSDAAHAAPQSAQYKHQFPIVRSPDDVAYTPRGGIAVVRASQHSPDQVVGPVGHADQIVVVNPVSGQRLIFADSLKCSTQDDIALTGPDGAANLVAASEARAVLVGRHHWSTGPTAGELTVVNVVDLTDAYGNPNAQPPGGPRCMLSWSKPGAGHVSDVAITPDGRFAVVNHKGWISVFQIDQTTIPAPAEFDTLGGIPTRQVRSLAMTQSALPTSPVKCVAVTARLVNGDHRVWAYVLDLSGAAPCSRPRSRSTFPTPATTTRRTTCA